jgi:hypothetical protein
MGDVSCSPAPVQSAKQHVDGDMRCAVYLHAVGFVASVDVKEWSARQQRVHAMISATRWMWSGTKQQKQQILGAGGEGDSESTERVAGTFAGQHDTRVFTQQLRSRVHQQQRTQSHRRRRRQRRACACTAQSQPSSRPCTPTSPPCRGNRSRTCHETHFNVVQVSDELPEASQ